MSDSSTLQINEIFYSIQGESTWAGLPCVFVRLKGCHLRCGYCDTAYAFFEGQTMSVAEILEQVQSYGSFLVEVTGGEPLLQGAVHDLMRALCDGGYTVLLETSGACPIKDCDSRVIRIMDLKTPGSGEVDRNHWDNLSYLSRQDQVKIVLCDRADYVWARQVIEEHQLSRRVGAVLLSPAGHMAASEHLSGCPGLAIRDLASWILEDHLDVRLQSQLHKQIWGPLMRGV